MNLVTLHHVGVAYDGYEALKNVDLTIAQDDFLGIIGPNGGGKTTLVKAILGTVPHTGEVVLAPELFRGKERLIGYMPQISNFDRTFPISVLEVVLSGLQGHRGFVSRYTKEDRAKALRLLETSGIGETARSPIGEVSGGQMQRALLCRAVISDPKLLILDEPTSGLDPRERVRFRNLVHALAADRIVILSTHIVSDVETIAGQIVMFRDHRLHCCDSASNICAQLQDRVFEVPANMALAPGQLLLSEREGAQGPVLRIASDEPPAQGTPVAACLEDAFLYIYRDVEEGERP